MNEVGEDAWANASSYSLEVRDSEDDCGRDAFRPTFVFEGPKALFVGAGSYTPSRLNFSLPACSGRAIVMARWSEGSSVDIMATRDLHVQLDVVGTASSLFLLAGVEQVVVLERGKKA